MGNFPPHRITACGSSATSTDTSRAAGVRRNSLRLTTPKSVIVHARTTFCMMLFYCIRAYASLWNSVARLINSTCVYCTYTRLHCCARYIVIITSVYQYIIITIISFIHTRRRDFGCTPLIAWEYRRHKTHEAYHYII